MQSAAYLPIYHTACVSSAFFLRIPWHVTGPGIQIDFACKQHETVFRLMPHLQAVVRLLMGKNSQKLPIPQIERKTIAVLLTVFHYFVL